MDASFVRDVITNFLVNGSRFSTSDIVYACSQKAGLSKEEAAKMWDDIRVCVRSMRDEFIGTQEFCDSTGMPHSIETYTRSKVHVPFYSEDVNVYHPEGWHADDYQFPEFDGMAPKELSQEEAEAKVQNFVHSITKEPQIVCSVKKQSDGSIILPSEIVERIGNLDADTIAQLFIMKGTFDEYEVYG